MGNLIKEMKAKAKKIKGYVANAESQTATYTNEETVISFVYTREPVAGANVQVKFVKETGEALAGLSPLTLSGNLGVGYDATDALVEPPQFPNQCIYASSAGSVDQYFFRKYRECSLRMES